MFLLPFGLFSQMQINWQQCYCGMESDLAVDVTQSGDEFLVLGRISAALSGGQVTCTNDDATWLLKIDNIGNIIWQKCIFHFGGHKMQKAIGSDYYFITGQTISEPYPDVLNLYLSKMDSSGLIIWERTLGNNIGIDDYHFFGASTNDGGIIGSVLIFSKGGDITSWYGGYDGWVIKLDSEGNTDWDFTLGSQNVDAVTSVEQTMDSGYIIAGYGMPDGISGNITTPSYTSSGTDAVIFKLDSLGNVEWDKTYGGSYNDHATRAISLPDGYLIAGGATSDDGYCEGSGWHEGYYQTGDRTLDTWLIRTDLNGVIIWQRCYGGSQTESVSRIFSTSDGGFVIFGSTHSFDGDVIGNPSNSIAKSSIWIFKINSTGDLIWQQCIGGHASEDVHGVIQHSDNNYTLAGEMFYSPSGDVNCSNFIYGSRYNYWLLGISDTTVNITETQQLNDNINVYPNPANTVLNIDFSNDYNIRNTTIEIVDINGKTILKLKIANVSTQLDIKKMNSGLYLMKIQNDKNLITKRIIIQ
jgi:hypothetical protein